MPTARSKLFRLPVKTEMKDYEESEYNKLVKHYDLFEHTVRQNFEEMFYLPLMQSGGIPYEIIEEEKMEFADMIKFNEQENERIRKLREQSEMEEEKKIKEILENKMLALKIENEKKLELVNENIRRQKELASTLVTKENIDEMIEKALTNQVSYDCAVDLSGEPVYDESVTNIGVTLLKLESRPSN